MDLINSGVATVWHNQQELEADEMEGTTIPLLLHEFHQHRLGATIEDVTYADAEVPFFDDIVKGVDARSDEDFPGRLVGSLLHQLNGETYETWP